MTHSAKKHGTMDEKNEILDNFSVIFELSTKKELSSNPVSSCGRHGGFKPGCNIARNSQKDGRLLAETILTKATLA